MRTCATSSWTSTSARTSPRWTSSAGATSALPTLNETREALGFDPYTDFGQITDDAATVEALRGAFGGTDAIDLRTGGLSEALASGTFVGPAFARVTARQFEALRDGDRLWYENAGFDADTLAAIKGTTLGDLILRHTGTRFLQDDVFTLHGRRGAASEPGGRGCRSPSWARARTARRSGAAPRATCWPGATGQALRGGDGDDTPLGGVGRDTPEGGTGADAFRFASVEDGRPDAPDRVLDFAPGEDRLDASRVPTRGGAFTASGAAEARHGRDGGGVRLLLASDGDGEADGVVEVRGVSSLTPADLVL